VRFEQPGQQLKVIKAPPHLKYHSAFRRWLLLLLLGLPAGATTVCIPA
jgi:hypothetical protein